MPTYVPLRAFDSPIERRVLRHLVRAEIVLLVQVLFEILFNRYLFTEKTNSVRGFGSCLLLVARTLHGLRRRWMVSFRGLCHDRLVLLFLPDIIIEVRSTLREHGPSV